MDKATIQAAVDKIDWEALIDPDHEELGGAAFKSTGMSAVECSGYACEVYRLLTAAGHHVEIRGFFAIENPGCWISDNCEGHDFCLVDDRFIVDPWLVEVDPADGTMQEVMDMATDEQVAAIYGDPRKWQHNLKLEAWSQECEAKNPPEPVIITELIAELLTYINTDQRLLSLLYDMDLMPEQVKRDSKDWKRMLFVANHHRRLTDSLRALVADIEGMRCEPPFIRGENKDDPGDTWFGPFDSFCHDGSIAWPNLRILCDKAKALIGQ